MPCSIQYILYFSVKERTDSPGTPISARCGADSMPVAMDRYGDLIGFELKVAGSKVGTSNRTKWPEVGATRGLRN
jgi:hypothetical protein